MAPTRLQLQNQAQRNKEYNQCWREMETQVQPPLFESELVDIFMNTLHGSYFKKMVRSMSSQFLDLVTISERIVNGLKTCKIPGVVASNQEGSKKPQGNFIKKKEGETSVVTTNIYPQYQTPMAPMSYYPFPYIAAIQYQ